MVKLVHNGGKIDLKGLLRSIPIDISRKGENITIGGLGGSFFGPKKIAIAAPLPETYLWKALSMCLLYVDCSLEGNNLE